MTPLVTIAVPVYNRLTYVAGAVASVAAQTHTPIELLVSDNGQQGAALRDLVAASYPRPFVLRHNPRSVDIVTHYNQIIAAASGEYFVLLSDDDLISPSFVAELLGPLAADPGVAAALARVEAFSEDGERVLGSTDEKPLPPAEMACIEFVRAWCANRHKFISFTTMLARTAELRAVGGYPEMDRGNGFDNALLLKLAAGRRIAFNARATFHHRMHDTSLGKGAPVASLALASRQFLHFLDHDPQLLALRGSSPGEYAELRGLVTGMVYNTYLSRWRTLYRGRLSRAAWVRAGFALPPHRVYTRQVLAAILDDTPVLSTLVRAGRGQAPRSAR